MTIHFEQIQRINDVCIGCEKVKDVIKNQMSGEM